MGGLHVSSADRVDAYLEGARARHVDELTQFASFASVSALDAHSADVLACADWVREQMASIGLDGVRHLDTGGNPAVYGEWLGAGAAPTILVYGHYDVQPADPIDAWLTPPFEPQVRDGAIFARGASDNKGPIFSALKAIEACLAVDGALPCNVKVLVEGEEELRSDHLDELLRRERDLLAADLLLNTDGAFLAPGVPSVPIGLRGMVALELTVITATSDLHSGLFGGVAPNALHVLADLVSTLHDSSGRVLVDGFYDGVESVSEREREAWAELPIDADLVREQAGVFELLGDPDASFLDRQWALPTLDLNGIWGGFEGQGIKTVIPAQAHAKLTCRLVCDQRTEAVLGRVVAHLRRHLPACARLRIDYTQEGTPPMLMSADHPAVLAARRALAAGFARPAVLTRLGVSVPINEIAARRLDMPAVMLNSSYPTDAFHAPNEHFTLESLDGGMRSAVSFLKILPDCWGA